jgi:hypothetical protein
MTRTASDVKEFAREVLQWIAQGRVDVIADICRREIAPRGRATRDIWPEYDPHEESALCEWYADLDARDAEAIEMELYRWAPAIPPAGEDESDADEDADGNYQYYGDS